MARPSTPNYGLPQYGPQGTGDALGVYSAYNVAMDIIDGILNQLKGLIDALEGRMDAAEDRLDDAEASIEQINQHLARIDQSIEQINQTTTNIQNQLSGSTEALWAAIEAILAHTQGSPTVDKETGDVTWNTAGSYAIGNINITSGSGYIRTHAASNQTNDLKAV